MYNPLRDALRRKLICLACFVLVLGFVSNASAELVGHWRFDEGSGIIAHDQSGNGNDGALINDPEWAIGIINGALQFDGIDDYVNCGNDPSLNVTDEVTIAAWVKLNSVPPAFSVLIAGKYSAYWLEWRDTKALSLSMFINGAYNGSGPTLDLADGDWHHIALTYDGTHKKGYHNREEVFSEGASGAIDVSGVNFLVGESHPADAGYNGCPDGIIDDVRVYNRALTQEEIQLMMRGKGYPLALGPVPEDDAIHENTWVSLGWRAGDFAVSHDVYLGDNFNDVNDGIGDTFRGNQDLVYFVAGFPGYPYPDGLVPGTTYYWRIDEVNDADPNSPWKGNVWSFWVPPKKAYEPVPSDGGKFIDSENLILNWTPGYGAILHTVYFGDDFDTVANATGGVAQGIATYDPGTLELEKTYYWRVDEFDAANTYTGDVWSFTTAKIGGGIRADFYHWNDPSVGGTGNPGPVQPFTTFVMTRTDPRIDFSWGSGEPDPAVGADQFSVRWTGEVEAAFTETYTFYTRTDDGVRLWINGRQLVDSWINQGTTEYSGEIDLVAGNTYSLVMEYFENGGGAVAELLWSSPSTPKDFVPQAALSPPIKASSPSPSNGATGTKMTPILMWGAGDFAASHEVYFGADANAVANADKSSPEYKGTKTLGDESYDPGKLAWFTEYFWRVDEVNAVNPDSPWVGNLWSFTTGDFLVIDDFEDYDAGDNQIWYSWIDGLGYGAPGTDPYHPGNGTGAAVGDETTDSYTEETIVHGGSKSMPISYDNDKQGYAKYSETELTLIAPRDWTEESVAELSLWFRGLPASVGSFVEGPAGTYTMTASGTDIWNDADEFHYAYKILTGTGSIVAKVESVENTNAWAKAGVMIRETLDPDSVHAFACVTPENGVSFQRRPSAGGASESTTQSGITAPYWVKLERSISGSFTISHSANGSTWEPVTDATPQNIPMGANVYIGLALTSHDAALTCEAVFSNVTFTGTVGPQWANQDIGIESNDAEALYVSIANSAGTPAVVVHDDPAAANFETWTEWIIPLQALADQGIVLTNVDRIAIGLGTQGNMTIPGGSGKMYIDDIRLYQPREAAE